MLAARARARDRPVRLLVADAIHDAEGESRARGTATGAVERTSRGEILATQATYPGCFVHAFLARARRALDPYNSTASPFSARGSGWSGTSDRNGRGGT